MTQLYKKKETKIEKMYGCEKLYFIDLIYQWKMKERERKENLLLTELLCDCICICGVSDDVPCFRGSRTCSEYVQCPLKTL